jgi:hypothetical protein
LVDFFKNIISPFSILYAYYTIKHRKTPHKYKQKIKKIKPETIWITLFQASLYVKLMQNFGVILEYRWLKDGRLVYIENDLPQKRQVKTTYKVEIIDNELNSKELASFYQYPTITRISPNSKYIMLHEYKGLKDVKIIKIK